MYTIQKATKLAKERKTHRKSCINETPPWIIFITFVQAFRAILFFCFIFQHCIEKWMDGWPLSKPKTHLKSNATENSWSLPWSWRDVWTDIRLALCCYSHHDFPQCSNKFQLTSAATVFLQISKSERHRKQLHVAASPALLYVALCQVLSSRFPLSNFSFSKRWLPN